MYFIIISDSYVKCHLIDKKKGLINKKKTKIINNECNPVWRQMIKYETANITGRSLLVSVWERQKGFEHNTPIGSVEIDIEQLNLNKLIIGWYKLQETHHQQDS